MRMTMKFVSLSELSVQVRWAPPLRASAVKPDGAAGAPPPPPPPSSPQLAAASTTNAPRAQERSIDDDMRLSPRSFRRKDRGPGAYSVVVALAVTAAVTRADRDLVPP